MTVDTGAAYGRRAGEYIETLGSIGTVHPADLELVTRWAGPVDGRLLDAGCGPGHWAGSLASLGAEVHGVDRVPEFIRHARRAHRGAHFGIGDLDALPYSDHSMSGVLAWYSLIHHEPATVLTPLHEFARVLHPGGTLLVGFFHGSRVEQFDHAVAGAYRWPAGEMAEQVRLADFEVTDIYTRTSHGARPHGALVARRSSATRGDPS